MGGRIILFQRRRRCGWRASYLGLCCERGSSALCFRKSIWMRSLGCGISGGWYIFCFGAACCREEIEEIDERVCDVRGDTGGEGTDCRGRGEDAALSRRASAAADGEISGAGV